MKLDILAFGAHPDDVELGCAGTILKHIEDGKKIGIIDLTRGELGTRGTAATRKKEAEVSAKMLGVSMRENLAMADGFFLNDKNHQLKVIQKIRQYQPDVVIVNAPIDRHPDHGRGAQLVSDACFLAGLPKIKTLLKEKSQKAWRPKAIYHYIQFNPHKPDFIIDISAHFEKKMETISAFASQFYNPHSKEPETLISSPEFFNLLKKRCEEHGKKIGVRYGEGFLFGTLHWKQVII
ncbi:MAG: bacillithiol biosynthesis deacetylase BshB1 [Bacteroidetes bacterium]|nr:bacillithiol biosynthesis deacetylase BshB1 [Bacteroidota bacterium]